MVAFEELAKETPGDPTIVSPLFTFYIGEAGNDSTYYDKARLLLDAAIEVDPDNLDFKHKRAVLDEPDPRNVDSDRWQEIRLGILRTIEDPFGREFRLGLFHAGLGDEKAKAALAGMGL